MANTLETLGNASAIAVHRSGTDLKDKTPLQNYQGATVGELVAAARPTQAAAAAGGNGAEAIAAATIAAGIVTATADDARSKATDTATNLISSLDLSAVNASFDFSFINLSTDAAHIVTLTAGSGVTLVGDPTIDGRDGTGNASGLFRVVRTSAVGATDAVSIFRIA